MPFFGVPAIKRSAEEDASLLVYKKIHNKHFYNPYLSPISAYGEKILHDKRLLMRKNTIHKQTAKC